MKNTRNGRWLAASTRDFWREGRHIPGYTLWDFIHGYFYARWPYLYIGVGTGEHPLIKVLRPAANAWNRLARLLPRKPAPDGKKPVAFADTYHGKVVPLPAARQLVEIKQEISLSLPETIIPYQKARDIILKNPDHIVALDCPCRVSRARPCLPLDVCLIVGEPFASFVSEHHPEKTRWISQDEAVAILEAEDERGHVHHAFMKDAMLGRFYAICNCCACCCGAMQAHQHGVPMLASSGYTARVDQELCIGCGVCQEFCQFSALSLADGYSQVDEALCMGCGVCVSKCSQEALSLVRAPQKGEPLEMQAMLASMDLKSA